MQLNNYFFFDYFNYLCKNLDDNGEVVTNVDFPRVFLLMHKWFMESDLLANMLYDIYVKYDEQNSKNLKNDDVSSSPSNNNNNNNSIHKNSSIVSPVDYRYKICYAFRYWINKFPFHFAMDITLTESVRRFSTFLLSKGHKDQWKLLDTSNLLV